MKKLKKHIDENGFPFSFCIGEEIDFGHIKRSMHLTAAPIRLVDGTTKYGKLHIEKEHKEQIVSAGFVSIEAFVFFVSQNFDTIREAKSYYDKKAKEKKTTYLIEVNNIKSNTLFIELSKNGRYWNVNSGGVFRKKYSQNKKIVWTLPALSHNSTTKNKGVANSNTAKYR